MRTACAFGITAGMLVANPPPGVAQWLQAKSAHYAVFYRAGYERDVAFVRTWLNRTERLMQEKYGVTPDGYFISVYLLPAPADGIDAGQSGQIRCCTRGTSGRKTGTIRLLPPSAPLWKATSLTSSLGLPKAGEDYHAKILLAEYIPVGHYAAQDARKAGGWDYYSAPEWFVQGLQEYDAIFHSTDTNRVRTSQRLLDWARRHPEKFACCAAGLAIADPYNGGAAFLAFLAARFGEPIHARLLRSAAPSFAAALADETRPLPLDSLYAGFRAWVDSIPKPDVP